MFIFYVVSAFLFFKHIMILVYVIGIYLCFDTLIFSECNFDGQVLWSVEIPLEALAGTAEICARCWDDSQSPRLEFTRRAAGFSAARSSLWLEKASQLVSMWAIWGTAVRPESRLYRGCIAWNRGCNYAVMSRRGLNCILENFFEQILSKYRKNSAKLW